MNCTDMLLFLCGDLECPERQPQTLQPLLLLAVTSGGLSTQAYLTLIQEIHFLLPGLNRMSGSFLRHYWDCKSSLQMPSLSYVAQERAP